MLPLFMAAHLIAQVFFSFGSWQFFAYVILTGIMVGGMQKLGTLSASLFHSFFHAMIFALASFSALVILLILITSGTFERHDAYDALTLSLLYLVVFFIGSMIGVTVQGLRDKRTAIIG